MNKKRNCILIFLFFGILTVKAQYSLSYNLNIGDTYRVVQNANQEIVQTMDGSEHIMNNLIEGVFIFKVETLNDSLITFNFSFDRFKMTSTSSMMGELMSVDTNDRIAESDVEGKLFSGLTESNLKMEMYKNGHIKSIAGTETMVNGMINKAGNFDDFTKELMKEAMNKEFGGKTLSESFEQLTFIYPNEEVKQGAKWNTTYNGKVSAENIWTLDNVSKDSFQISGQSKVNFKTDDTTISMNLEGTTQTKVTSSRDSGFISSMTSNSKAEGISVMKTMEGVEIPTKMTTKITYKVTKNVQ
ncbi:MAG: DUF6263 family protein [Bacteroidota bacterium]